MPPHPTSWRSVLILSYHLRLGLSSGRLRSGLPTKIRYAPLFSPIRATCPAHLIILDYSVTLFRKKKVQCGGWCEVASASGGTADEMSSKALNRISLEETRVVKKELWNVRNLLLHKWAGPTYFFSVTRSHVQLAPCVSVWSKPKMLTLINLLISSHNPNPSSGISALLEHKNYCTNFQAVFNRDKNL
jgi:hypothetical protein